MDATTRQKGSTTKSTDLVDTYYNYYNLFNSKTLQHDCMILIYYHSP